MKFSILQFILISSLIADSFQYRRLGAVRNPKPRRKLIHSFAQKIVNYFDLENVLKTTQNEDLIRNLNEEEIYHGCDSLEDIKRYFFDTYSGFDSSNMSATALEHLVGYLVTRYPKEKEIEHRTKQLKCPRKKVKRFYI